MSNEHINLTDAQKLVVAVEKATCPFIGSAIVEGLLPVGGTLDQPLASIDDVRSLGNVAGGDLGIVLAMFARGNHARVRDAAGLFTVDIESIDLFSLDFPGSQGSHAGDSGILLGDPPRRPPYSFSLANFDRLARKQIDGRLNQQAVGEFIAENARRDDATRKVGLMFLVNVARDLFGVLEAIVPASIRSLAGSHESVNQAHRIAMQRFTKMLGEDTVVASAGEFGLLFALLATASDSSDEAGPTVSVAEARMMFENKRLPRGWDSKPKSMLAWAHHTLAIAFHAYRRLI